MLMPETVSGHERADDTTENARDRTTDDLDIAPKFDEEYLEYRTHTIDWANMTVANSLDGLT
jgi:hypothetical protein